MPGWLGWGRAVITEPSADSHDEAKPAADGPRSFDSLPSATACSRDSKGEYAEGTQNVAGSSSTETDAESSAQLAPAMGADAATQIGGSGDRGAGALRAGAIGADDRVQDGKAAGTEACGREQPPSTLTQWCDEHLLNRAEQLAAAVLTAIALVCGAAWWTWQGGATGRMIDVDLAPAVPISFVVNVNEADWPELSQLPGIGPVLAQRIVASREQDGPFRSVDDLRRVRGIGPITIERLRPHIAVLSGSSSVADGGKR